jgi:trehalose 6-phosphate synthase
MDTATLCVERASKNRMEATMAPASGSVDHWNAFARDSPLAILADLDGTLIPFASSPDEAVVEPSVAAVLQALSALPDVSVAIVSGRTRGSLEHALREAPGLWLAAEYGGWLRAEGAWRASPASAPPDLRALDALTDAFERIAAQYARAWVERKTWSVCLHYRDVRRRERMGLYVQANVAFHAFAADHPGFERVEAPRAFEAAMTRQRKGAAIPWIRERMGGGGRLLALGDDLPDEEMFRALAPRDESIQVGGDPYVATAARWTLPDPAATVAFLAWILEARRERPTPPLLVAPARVAPRSARVTAPTTPFRLLAISNRLPDLRQAGEADEADRERRASVDERRRKVGGLVSALEPVLAARGGLWLGWSGRSIPESSPGAPEIADDLRPPLAWIDLPAAFSDKYYAGFCNGALWPLFHSMPSRARFADDEWEAYEAANEAFAGAAAELVGPDAAVWVHDYHALLVGRALRRRGHRGPLGLFLHIPFPCIDLFSTIPWAAQLLDGMLDFDLVAFHTPSYVENFRRSAGALTAAHAADDAIELRGRRIRLAALPLGIVPEGFQEPPEPGMAEELSALLQAIAPSRLVIGVDRLDYTKGIPERLRAFGRLLEMFPEWRTKVSLVQISVPSRADIPDYAEQRALVENVVGRVNGQHGEASWVPIRYLYRSYGRNHLSQLYRAADVGYVTPLRDGMNLVAKEFVAAQDPENPGALVLSRFAGTAVELKDAILTNPYHLDGMAKDLDRALRMPLGERRERHTRLHAAISRTTALTWAEEFLRMLEACRCPGA